MKISHFFKMDTPQLWSAEPSHCTFDFSSHDHHIQFSRILTEALSIGFKWYEFLFLWFSFMKYKLVYLYLFKETVQTANFTVFTMCGRELPAEKPYFWWKLKKLKRTFLNVKARSNFKKKIHHKEAFKKIDTATILSFGLWYGISMGPLWLVPRWFRGRAQNSKLCLFF